MNDTLKRLLLILAAIIATILLVAWARGRTDRTFDGTAEWQSEKSEFFPAGHCSASPLWLDTDAEGALQIRERWEDLRRPAAVRVVFVGDLTAIGRWGHLGRYWREVRPKSVLDVTPLPQACK